MRRTRRALAGAIGEGAVLQLTRAYVRLVRVSYDLSPDGRRSRDAIRAYRDVGYEGMLMPDHVPKIDAPYAAPQAFAFCFGYIQALIQIVRMEG